MWIKFSVNPPPADIDILVKLEDGSCAVGRKNEETGAIVPVNVVCADYLFHDINFTLDVVSWKFIPD